MSKASSGEAAASVAATDEDTWVCKKCGWAYPNHHPSAKHRRNHRKQCGKVKGFEIKAPPQHDAGSSDNVSSDDEDHHRAARTGLADSVNPQQQQPAVMEDSKKAIAAQPETKEQPAPVAREPEALERSVPVVVQPETPEEAVPVKVQEETVPDSTLPVKEVSPSADNDLRNEVSTETGEDMKKASFDARKEPSDLIREVVEEPATKTSQEITPVEPESESEVLVPPTKLHEVETSKEPESVGSPPSAKVEEVEASKQEEPLDEQLIKASAASHAASHEHPPTSDDPPQAAAPHPDSWEQLLDAQLSTPQQKASDDSSSKNNGPLSSTAFPESSFSTEIERSVPLNGNPFAATPQTSNPNGVSDAAIRNVETSGASLAPVAEEPQDGQNPFFQLNEKDPGGGAATVFDKGEASSSNDGDIKPHVALKALFDEDPRPRPQLSSENDEQEALVQSTRRNSNVLQKMIETVRNSPAKFNTAAAAASNRDGEPRNKSKSRWSNFICCSQVR